MVASVRWDRIKDSFIDGATYKGSLKQFSASYDVVYQIGKPLNPPPAAVLEARQQLGFDADSEPVELCCQAAVTIQQFGLSKEPVVISFDAKGGEGPRMLIHSLDKPELGYTVGFFDYRREEFQAGDENWWIGEEVVITAKRTVSDLELSRLKAARNLGLKEGAEYKGKANHPIFKPYDIIIKFDKLVATPGAAGAAARSVLGWKGEPLCCMKGFQSIPEFNCHDAEVIVMADEVVVTDANGGTSRERRVHVVPVEKTEIGTNVARLSADGSEMVGGEYDWWLGREPEFVLTRR